MPPTPWPSSASSRRTPPRPSGTRASDATFDVARIDEIEREVKHDVIAFLTHLAEIVGPEARFVHQGMTSSDVLDTCLNVQLVRAADLLIADVDALLAALKRRAFEHKMTPTIGRSHGIHAEPTTFGLKLAYAYAEFARAARAARRRAQGGRDLRHLRRGRHLRQHRSARRSACRQGDGPCRPSRSRPRSSRATATRCISRRSASSPPRSSGSPTEIRHLQRTEVLEAEEFFSAGQKGSSAMPHKRNPVLTENLTGLARMVRAYATAGDGERRALARARHLALLGRAHDRARRHGDARFRAHPPRRRDRQAAWSIPRTCRRISTGSAASSIRSACCSR